MSNIELTIKSLNEYVENISKHIESLTPAIAGSAQLFADTLLSDNKILCCTSANAFTTGQNFCNNLQGNMSLSRPSLPVYFLGNNTSHILSVLDKKSSEHIYAQQIFSLANKNDLLFIISGTDDSNISNAIDAAIAKEMSIICLSLINKSTTFQTNELGLITIHLPELPALQLTNMMFLITQILADLVERILFGELLA